MNGTYPPSFSSWAIVDYDWSESRNLWSAARPYMTCEETMLAQARARRALNPSGKTWVYRNSIKALPWFTSVREKLQDRSFWGFFLPLKNCKNYDCGPNASQNLYHDFERAVGRAPCGAHTREPSRRPLCSSKNDRDAERARRRMRRRRRVRRVPL